jgi:photosystem II stability/assembly factor-like uncharacterized protein
MKRKCLSTILVLALASAFLLGSPASLLAASFFWSAQASGTSVLLSAMTARDSSHVWAVGQAGTIRYTNNGGATWAAQASGTGEDLQGISSTGPTRVWAVGDHGEVRMTANGGASWGGQNSGVANDLTDICAIDEDHAWLVGWNGTIRYTQAGGTPWVGQNSHTIENLWGVSAADRQHAWAVGNFGKILYTSNAGTTWSIQNSGTTEHLRDVFAQDSNRVWAVGDNGTILRTTNGGGTWERQTSNTVNGLRAVSAADDSHAWIVGQSPTVLFSSDGGAQWFKQACPVSTFYYGLATPDPLHTFAGGANGNIMAGNGPPTWYLAEGTTAWGFSTYISIANPNPSAVPATITYMPTGASTVQETITLPASSQTTLTNDHLLQVLGGQKDFSTKVECNNAGMTIAVDRTMTWTGTGAPSPEGHSSVGVTSPSNTWYLPEGSTNWGFETWVLVQNPNGSEASCDVTYMIEGEAPKTVNHKVPAYSRESFSMEKDTGNKDASIKVVSNMPVIPERAMYRYSRREGHDSIGTTTAASDYYLAEGTSAWGFTTYVLVQNPGDTATDVTLTYMTPSGARPQASFPMAPDSRKTIRVNDVPGMGNTDFSVAVHATSKIIAERAMYWGGNTPAGEACHDSIGMASPHMTFYLPDGDTTSGRETWTLVQNPNGGDVTVDITYMTPSGQGNVTRTETISANSRKTFNMVQHSGINGRAAILVASKTPGKKIMCERAMYWNNKGAGTDTIGGFGD